MPNAPIQRKRSARITRAVVKSILFLVAFIVVVFLLTLTPPVQRFITKRVEVYLEKKLQTRVDIDRIAFDPFGNVRLKGVYVEDRNKDTMLTGALIKTRVNIFQLFSNKILVRHLELKDITARINRNKTDSVFNFQFIVDAFTPKPDPLDTAAVMPLEADLKKIQLDNVHFIYADALTGSTMDVYTGSLSTAFSSTDINKNIYLIPHLEGDSIRAVIRQIKPITKGETLAEDIAEAKQPIPMQLMIGSLDLSVIDIRYDNDVSATYADAHIGNLKSTQRLMDLQQRKLYFEDLVLNNSTVNIRMEKQEAVTVAKEVVQEVVAQQEAGWDIRADNIRLDSNQIRFDDNSRVASGPYAGIDYDHLNVTGFRLQVEDFVMNKDSLGGRIAHAALKDQSGFVLEELKGDILYSNNQAYARDLYIKTPGSEVKRSLGLTYASKDELVKHFDRTIMEADIDNSYVQVKDILAFAPSLRRNKAFSNPNATWRLDLEGNGTVDRLVINNVNFSGLSNTQLSASGTLTGLSNTRQAGGDFNITHLHTTQSDFALFTGKRLSTAEVRIPEDITLNGRITGNSGTITTRMNVRTSSGAANVNGRFANLGDPNNLSYDAIITTSSLNLGRILPKQEKLGIVSGNFTVKGKGTTQNNLDTRLVANISAIDYDGYRYRNAKVDGTIRNSAYDLHVEINDPNADANVFVKGDFNGNSFTVNGMVDSLKTQPLGLTVGPLIARGKIDGSISNIDSDNMDADVLITKGLFVSGKNRLPLDTVQLKSGRTAAGNFLTLQSDIANAHIEGRYRLTQLGDIIQNSIRPYFNTGSPPVTRNLQPYNFNFTASINYNPVFNSFVPKLSSFDNIRAEGTVTPAGINAQVQVPSLVYDGNEFQQLLITAAPSAEGLLVNATASAIKGGKNLQLYNTRVNALIANNDINFTAATDDMSGRNKYRFSGLLSQTSPRNYTLTLNPDSILLNYQLWTVSPGNRINITPNSITANNFVLQQGSQQLSINSADFKAGALDVQFSQFQLSTITAFIKNDSLPANGVLNGNLTITNIMESPAFTGHLLVNDLSFQKDTIGNVDLRVTAGTGNRHQTTATISGRGNDITMTGYFIPAKGDLIADLDVNIRQLQLATLEGAFAKAFTDASGSVNGRIKIGGKLSDPQVTGDIGFNNASFIPTILGTRFRIGDQKLTMTENGISFTNFIIEDSTGNKLVLNGRAVSTNFLNYDFDLFVSANNFQVLDTKKGPGKIYYGKLNISADLRIKGTELKPRADGTIVVNEGTDLSFLIPQVEEGVAQRQGIVEFIDMDSPENDTLFLAAYDSLTQSGIRGFDVTTTIEIKKEAIFNAVIDEANGDFLNMQGEAQLTAGIDPSGKITLAGNYVLEQGSYQLSFNFIQRKFEIQKGSNIVWMGEPTTAQLDIKAIYVANTAPLDLVSSQLPVDANRSFYLQRLPFEVHLDLTGELLRPKIDFDLILPEKSYGVSNDIVTAVQSRLDLIRQDEGEVNKQVFSLLLLNRFVGDNPFESSTDAFNFNTYARQSVSKLLTEQLNQLAANLIDGVDIDFDVISTDDYTMGSRASRTDLSIGLSKRLLSNRLKITVGSNFQLEGPQQSNQQSNNIAGNIAAEYQLSKDGRYMLRFYRQNEYQGIVDGYIIETGVSFIFSVDYERFMQIFRKRRRPTRSAETTPVTPAQPAAAVTNASGIY